MSYKTKRAKTKKRAVKFATKAWEAIEENNPKMALKLAKHAVKENPSNPILWNDLGFIAQQNNELDEAEKAFQGAIFLAPEYAEAYANLAAVSAKKGRLHQATRLQEKAVALAPTLLSFQENLELYRSLTPPEEFAEEAPQNQIAPFPATDLIDWKQVEEQLQRDGVAFLPKLFTQKECLSLIQLYEQEDNFEKTIDLNEEGHGRGEYKFFQRPLPEIVEAVRAAIYEKIAPIANHWNELLKNAARYPNTFREFLKYCHQNGQRRSTPILLRYTQGGYNELHQDIWGKIYFPFQLAITLSKRGEEGFTGGEFVIAEDGSRKKTKRFLLETNLGDGVLFCTRHRLTNIAQTYALIGVKHGLASVTSGERYCLGVPFHEYFGAPD
jgi:hypothetical protein